MPSEKEVKAEVAARWEHHKVLERMHAEFRKELGTTKKPPCCYPLGDGRRCLECISCQGDVVWVRDADFLMERAARAALSAAEKEREGECRTCDVDGRVRQMMEGEGAEFRVSSPCPDCGGSRLSATREGDTIEKLREWCDAVIDEEQAHLNGEQAADDPAYAAVGEAQIIVLRQVLSFLNDLQEQSTGGEG